MYSSLTKIATDHTGHWRNVLRQRIHMTKYSNVRYILLPPQARTSFPASHGVPSGSSAQSTVAMPPRSAMRLAMLMCHLPRFSTSCRAPKIARTQAASPPSWLALARFRPTLHGGRVRVVYPRSVVFIMTAMEFVVPLSNCATRLVISATQVPNRKLHLFQCASVLSCCTLNTHFHGLRAISSHITELPPLHLSAGPSAKSVSPISTTKWMLLHLHVTIFDMWCGLHCGWWPARFQDGMVSVVHHLFWVLLALTCPTPPQITSQKILAPKTQWNTMSPKLDAMSHQADGKIQLAGRIPSRHNIEVHPWTQRAERLKERYGIFPER